MAQVIGEFSQWKYGDPPRRDPRDPKWLGPDADEGMEADHETVQRLGNQREFENNRSRAETARLMLMEFQTGTGRFAPWSNGPGGMFRGMTPRETYENLTDSLMTAENSAVQNYHDLGYEKNPYMWNQRPPNKLAPPTPISVWPSSGLAPRMLIDKLHRE